jgi:hypothetical protein
MAAKIVAVYDAIEKELGLAGKMRLAVMTGVPSMKAEGAPDSPEIMAKFAAAFKEITKKECPIK